MSKLYFKKSNLKENLNDFLTEHVETELRFVAWNGSTRSGGGCWAGYDVTFVVKVGF